MPQMQMIFKCIFTVAAEIKVLLYAFLYRLQDEISQREESEANMQSFRQVQLYTGDSSQKLQ